MTDSQRYDALKPGTEIHSYRVERELGSGGFAISYLAGHATFGSRHVLKEYLPADTASRREGDTVGPKSERDRSVFEWGLDRFFQEAKLLNSLDHPNVVKVTDVFRANGTAYFVMPYLEGQTLREWMKQRPRPGRKELLDLSQIRH
jgi:serine/threonine protein kinase